MLYSCKLAFARCQWRPQTAAPSVTRRQTPIQSIWDDDHAGLTCADAAKASGTFITKISRMETGERGLYVDDVAALLGLYHVPANVESNSSTWSATAQIPTSGNSNHQTCPPSGAT